MDANHSNSGRPPRRSPIPGKGRLFVETEVFRRVREAVEVGDTPALVLGPGGSGKTSLLAALADEWARSGRKVVFLSLDEFGRGEDILLLLRRQLAEMSRLPRFDEGDVITGSSRAALRATVDLIEAAESDLLIVLDGLDAMAESLPIVQLLGQVRTGRSRQTRMVVSSRDRRGVTSRIFRSIFEVGGLTALGVRVRPLIWWP